MEISGAVSDRLESTKAFSDFPLAVVVEVEAFEGARLELELDDLDNLEDLSESSIAEGG